MDLNASLLREKFTIKEKRSDSDTKALNTTAPSTRFPIDLNYSDLPPKRYIIRTNNMHNCVRVAASLIDNYKQHGPIEHRPSPMDWTALWGRAFSPYERIYSKKPWISIYNDGEIVFAHGKHHPFFDVIERFDASNQDDNDYTNSIQLAKTAFKQAGKDVEIEYDANIALVTNLSELENRCSMILRWADHTATFNYTTSPLTGDSGFNPSQSLITAAYFLEGVQLSFFIGKNTALLKKGIIERFSDTDIQTKKAKQRVIDIQDELTKIEQMHRIRYRPEAPNFDFIIYHTEEFISSTL